jgi:hypothetical protein
MEFPFTESSYQTAPLAEYRAELRDRAAELFRLVADRTGPSRAKEHRGSFSVIAASSDATAAKIVIYEAGRGKMNGPELALIDGIYILIRLNGNVTGRTLGVAPMHHERFAYFRLAETQDLEETADFLAACAGAQ